MSAAGSRLHLESPSAEQADPFNELPEEQQQAEKAALAKFASISSNGPVIAIDLDDVLSQTNQMTITTGRYVKLGQLHARRSDHFKNPFWGTPHETFVKVKEFYATDRIFNTKVVPGALEGVKTLKNMGFRLVIVTARTEDNADESWEWVNKHFPGIFESIICTGQFKDAHKTGHEFVTKLSKAEVCANLGAVLLIDDSSENALQCAASKKPIQVLLFGDYEWNKRVSGPLDARDEMSFDRRLEAGNGKEFWKDECVLIPEGAPLTRVRDWNEVVRWVQGAKLIKS
ncbi:hypothetical protein DXG01_004254 [Tephrocybe rancida]|nr:hypothetical protein DXG01_004254 [Tephrocybe rancida]